MPEKPDGRFSSYHCFPMFLPWMYLLVYRMSHRFGGTFDPLEILWRNLTGLSLKVETAILSKVPPTRWNIRYFSRLGTCTLGWASWNLSCLEFKFDDTRLSYWHKNKIGRIEKKNCCFLTLLILCPVGCLSKTEQANRAEN